jgi:hypothetical protein
LSHYKWTWYTIQFYTYTTNWNNGRAVLLSHRTIKKQYVIHKGRTTTLHQYYPNYDMLNSWSWWCGSWIYNYLCNQFLSSLKLWVSNHGEVYSIHHYVIKWFSQSTPVSSTNKTDRHNRADLLLKEALNTIILTLTTVSGNHLASLNVKPSINVIQTMMCNYFPLFNVITYLFHSYLPQNDRYIYMYNLTCHQHTFRHSYKDLMNSHYNLQIIIIISHETNQKI